MANGEPVAALTWHSKVPGHWIAAPARRSSQARSGLNQQQDYRKGTASNDRWSTGSANASAAAVSSSHDRALAIR